LESLLHLPAGDASVHLPRCATGEGADQEGRTSE